MDDILNYCEVESGVTGFPCDANAITAVSLGLAAAGLGLLMVGWLMKKVSGQWSKSKLSSK